ncbi:MAG: hypothetical protein NT019_01255 [Candidatus Adlerbacteria bacterium]|nr:hypothetical protein [Candidatus Adlerbacteria bacterium]
MLNPFPQLLFLGFFVPTLLRLAVAIALGYSAYQILKHRDVISNMSLPILGKPHVALVWVSTSATALVAAALLFGYGTQYAAVLGAVISLKYSFIPSRLHALSPLSRSAYLLMFVISLSLLISGAGAFAMDLPL